MLVLQVSGQTGKFSRFKRTRTSEGPSKLFGWVAEKTKLKN